MFLICWKLQVTPLFPGTSKPALEATWSPIQWVPGLHPGLKRSGHEVNTHLYLMLRLRINGDVPPQPYLLLFSTQQ